MSELDQTYSLVMNNVDNYPSVLRTWSSEPTADEIRKVLADYWCGAMLDRAIDDLIRRGLADLSDGSSTTLEIQHVW